MGGLEYRRPRYESELKKHDIDLKFVTADKFFEQSHETELKKHDTDSEVVETNKFHEQSHENDHKKIGKNYYNGYFDGYGTMAITFYGYGN